MNFSNFNIDNLKIFGYIPIGFMLSSGAFINYKLMKTFSKDINTYGFFSKKSLSAIILYTLFTGNMFFWIKWSIG